MPSNLYPSVNGMNIALISMIAASVLFVNVVPTNNNYIFRLNHMTIAQTTPYSSHSHFPGLFYNSQDLFHSLLPITNIETSTFLDKAGDALSSSGSFVQPHL